MIRICTNITVIQMALTITDDLSGLHWNEHQQGLFLGALYWLNWLTQIPGAHLAERYGGKCIFGALTFCSSTLCFLIPITATNNFTLLIVLRVIQGAVLVSYIFYKLWFIKGMILNLYFHQGFTKPAMLSIIGKWIPTKDRSKFLTNTMGHSIGNAIFYPIFGCVIAFLSWELVYYLVGIFGLIWFIFWQYYVYDSPAQHPYIDLSEKNFILTSLGSSEIKLVCLAKKKKTKNT